MKQRFYLYRRGETFYLQDSRTGKQQSLETKDRNTALRLLELKRQTEADPAYSQFLLKTCLATRDPLLPHRTWTTVMEELQTHGKESSRVRCARAMRAKAFNQLRHIKLIETTAEDFLAILRGGNTSTVHYLKRLHNLALGLGWLALPVLAPRLWPKPRSESRRGITLAEHQRILATLHHREWSLFLQLLWEVGAAQGDAAALSAENIDWQTHTLSYQRMKTGSLARLAISSKLATLLRQLPETGPLFPKISQIGSKGRASDFYWRCRRLGITGVTLHSYRYAWAERAKTCGYPERFAQEALGHNSKAVHRAYAKKAQVLIPTLEDYESKMIGRLAPAREVAMSA